MSRRVVPGLVAAALFIAAEPARAGTISESGPGIQYAGVGSEIELMSVAYGSNTWNLTLAPGSTASFSVGQGCTGSGSSAHCAGGISSMHIDLAGGDDSYAGAASLADDVAGGAGSDTANYASRTAPVTVTLDDTANDGEANEKDNVRSDVENVIGGSGADRLAGSAGPNRIDGGPGADVIEGGTGNDTLIGGDGADRINSRNGVADTVDCGASADTVVGDSTDQISGCEDAQLAPPPGTPGPVVDDIVPVLTAVSVSPRTFRVSARRTATSAAKKRPPRGTRFRYRLSHDATVTITIKRALSRGRYRTSGTLTRASKAGINRVAFSGRIGSKKLKPGSYRASLRAVKGLGKSKVKHATFRVVAG